jgi:hypothetical protein
MHGKGELPLEAQSGGSMAIKRPASFNPKSFLDKMGEGRTIGAYHKDQIIFSQGEPAEAVFYIAREGEGHGRFGPMPRRPARRWWWRWRASC